MLYFETSAKNAIGIDEAFYAVAETALKQKKRERMYFRPTLFR